MRMFTLPDEVGLHATCDPINRISVLAREKPLLGRCWAEHQRHLATGRCLAWLPPLRDVLTAMRMAGTVHALLRSEARRGNGCTRARMHGHVMSLGHVMSTV